MNIQIFGSSKSFDSKKAERWFKERRIKYQYIDLPSKGLSPREYQSVKQKVGFDALVNMKCRAYEDLYMAYITVASLPLRTMGVTNSSGCSSSFSS